MRQDQPLERQFFRFVLPSMASQLLCGFFVVVDGFFIGRNMGDAGLAAINVAWPLVQVLLAVGLALGVGGSVCAATALGAGDEAAARRAVGNTLTALAAASVVISLVFYFAHPYLLPWMGADESLMPLACEYLRVVSALAFTQIFANGLVPLLRGTGRSMTAMAVMILGLVANIFLDWLFIERFQWGLWGAAVATMAAQGGCVAVALPLVLTGRTAAPRPADLRPRGMLLRQIIRLGASPFGLSVSTSIVLLLNNIQAQRYGGTGAVAVYAILSYVTGSFLPLMTGVGDGAQPLISYANGAKDHTALVHLRRKGLATVLATGAACSLLCFAGREMLPMLFGAGEATIPAAAQALWYLVVSFPLVGLARFSCSYFCAVGQARAASLLAYGEPLVVQPVFLFLLPLTGLGLQGVWAAYPATAVVIGAAALWLLRRASAGEATGL